MLACDFFVFKFKLLIKASLKSEGKLEVCEGKATEWNRFRIAIFGAIKIEWQMYILHKKSLGSYLDSLK